MLFETSGSETLKATSVRTQTATEEVVMVPSVFAEYDLGMGGLSLGIEMVVGTGGCLYQEVHLPNKFAIDFE